MKVTNLPVKEKEPVFSGYLRPDGRKGIRNCLLIVYLVECAHHVSREIASAFDSSEVQVIGFSGCIPNAHSNKVLRQLCTHSNVGGALLVSLGCEGFDRQKLFSAIEESGRPVHLLSIQQTGGTRKTIDAGRVWMTETIEQLKAVPRVPMCVSDLIVGTLCGGSDATSGLTANPAIGRCMDRLIQSGGCGIFEETGELIGCEQIMAGRAENTELGVELTRCVNKAARYFSVLGHPSFSPGNADGGLTTQEEKSMGAYAKSGSSKISGIIQPGDVPTRGGLYLMDVVPDGEVRFGIPNINDTAGVVQLIACGSHVILFATARGSVVGSVISPVIKICANPETYRRMSEDMDIDAGRIIEGSESLEGVGTEIFDRIISVAKGHETCSETLGHREFVLTYKSFEPLGPACFPA